MLRFSVAALAILVSAAPARSQVTPARTTLTCPNAAVSLVMTCSNAPAFDLETTPFILDEASVTPRLPFDLTRDVSSKTPASLQTVDTTKKNIILITAGQSNAVNTAPLPYVPVNAAKIDNISLYDGGIYKAEAPLLGCSSIYATGGNFAMPLADKLITDGVADRVIVACTGISGSSIADWGGGPTPYSAIYSGQYKNRIVAALARLKQKGIVEGPNVNMAILFGQGESDNGSTTTQAQYVAAFNSQANEIIGFGFGGRVLIAKQTYVTGGVSSIIQAAQSATAPVGVINNMARIYLGANADALVGNVCGGNPCRETGSPHFTNDGIVAYATDPTHGWRAALHATGAPF